MLILVNDDIFTTGAQFIAHQCNTTSFGQASGIANEIFKRFPYSDCYKNRTNFNMHENVLGTIQICGDGLEKRGIINMFAQCYPGPVKAKYNNEIDSENLRKKWFHSCLMEIAKIPNLNSIAFPDHIGCGLGGGNWEWYSEQLEKFSEFVENKDIKVLIYNNIRKDEN